MATERRLIDANELLRMMRLYDERQKTDMWETSEVEYLLKELPAEDVVEVVRCKDCKHQRYHSCYREADRIEEMMAKKGIIFVHNAPTYSIRSLDDFCSYGERRTDNERKAD